MNWKCEQHARSSQVSIRVAPKDGNAATSTMTMDKVKEGIFNSLYDVSGIGLDLFAGSGASGR